MDNEMLVEMAKGVAIDAHLGHFRRNGVTPYIEHPRAVAARLTDPQEISVAWLHDVLEDSDYTANDLYELAFPADVVSAVQAMTKQKETDYDTYLAIVRANPIARRVKIMDINCNLADDPTPRQVAKYIEALKFLEN